MDATTGVQLENLRSLLRMILFQCVESLADSQWELRRMGHQVQRYPFRILRQGCNTLGLICDDCEPRCADPKQGNSPRGFPPGDLPIASPGNFSPDDLPRFMLRVV